MSERCIRQFPEVEKMFIAGELNLTVVVRIARVPMKENAEEILAWIKEKPFRGVELFVSRHETGRFMRDMVKPVIFMTESVCAGNRSGNEGGTNARSVSVTIGDADEISPSRTPGKCKASFASATNVGSRSTQHIDNKSDKNPASAPCGKPETAKRVLIDEKFTIQFTVDPTFMGKLATVRSLLSTKYPQGIGFEKIFTILMTEYLYRHSPEVRIQRRNVRKKRKEKKKLSNKYNPGTRNTKSSRDTNTCRKIKKRIRHIPRAVKAERTYGKDLMERYYRRE